MLNLIGHSLVLAAILAAPPDAGRKLPAGSHQRSIKVDGLDRSYTVHVPKQYDAAKPTPLVLVLHGGFANASITVGFTGMNEKADRAGFIAVYPNGTGLANTFLAWNAGMWRPTPGAKHPDDVKFLSKMLDELEASLNVDKKRVYATGISNGGMMCYRLAAELSDRIAAIAPVSGTMCLDAPRPARPVPVIHFHGSADKIVPTAGPPPRSLITFQPLDTTIAAWVKLDRCPSEPAVTKLPDAAKDGTTITKEVFGPGRDGAEVVLVLIEGGGHTWPGRDPKARFLGPYTKNVSANDMIWDFFQRHPMK